MDNKHHTDVYISVCYIVNTAYARLKLLPANRENNNNNKQINGTRKSRFMVLSDTDVTTTGAYPCVYHNVY